MAISFRAPFVPILLACLLLVVAPLRPAAAAGFTPAQRQEIEQILHDYLVHNPEVLIDALRDAEAQLTRDADAKASQALNDRRREVFADPVDPVGGNPHGDATIVEFFDYRCPYCKQVQPSLRQLIEQDPRLRLVYKELPVLGPASVTAAHAALAAQKQGKYEAFHTAMMAARGQITDDTVYRIAGSVGLDLDRLKKDMAAPEVEQALKANLALADALNIHGTPAFIVGDRIVPGAVGLDALKDMVADARKQ